jgi:hypothetical protein
MAFGQVAAVAWSKSIVNDCRGHRALPQRGTDVECLLGQLQQEAQQLPARL